ncbi:sugar transferase [Prosthecochloris sp. CIB 2401]|uniref:sugar transferase n=1 Tax=Prosthecochloris sp. CIB 2401 TaxID=1868325 RepID=UPI0009F2AF47|nr:sugar transferase [Prosthecochloris sp. CIB 2401]
MTAQQLLHRSIPSNQNKLEKARMKTLIIIRENAHSWLRDTFPGQHPLLVRICNKSFLEFLFDFSIIAGAREVRIVSDGDMAEIRDFCHDGGRWGLNISYATIQKSDTITQIHNKNRRFYADERIIVLDNLLFIEFNKNESYTEYLASSHVGMLLSSGQGSVYLDGADQQSILEQCGSSPHISIPELGSLPEYFRLSAEILRQGSRYILPGYSNEDGCYIGRNVVIHKGAEIKKPVIIGNNVQIMPGCVIGPEAVIGSTVIIDRESLVTGSIVMHNTFVGEQLEVKDKIASGNRLMDPATGASLQLVDAHLLSEITAEGAVYEGIFRRLVHVLAALLLFMAQLLPYLFLRPFVGKPVDGGTGHEHKIAQLFNRLSLDRFPQLFRVFSGSLRLIGSQPAVFRYAETEEWPENEMDARIVEQFCTLHSHPFGDIPLLLKALLNRKESKITAS